MSSPFNTSSWKDSSLSCPALEVDECDDPPRPASGVVPRPFFLTPAFMCKVQLLQFVQLHVIVYLLHNILSSTCSNMQSIQFPVRTILHVTIIAHSADRILIKAHPVKHVGYIPEGALFRLLACSLLPEA